MFENVPTSVKKRKKYISEVSINKSRDFFFKFHFNDIRNTIFFISINMAAIQEMYMVRADNTHGHAHAHAVIMTMCCTAYRLNGLVCFANWFLNGAF